MTEGKLLLTVREAAALLGVSTQIIYRQVNSRELPAKRFGRAVYISRIELEKWLGAPTGQADAGNQQETGNDAA